MESPSMFPTAADWANAAADNAIDAAKAVSKVALAAHDRIDKLEARLVMLELKFGRIK